MQCARCGTAFEGRFCPACGAPAGSREALMPPGGAPTVPPGSWPCPRCGTPYFGNFCPRCGLPTAAWAYRPPKSSSGRTVLSILWTLVMIAFFVLAATDFAGLAVSPTLVVPGIEEIRSGRTANPGLDIDARNWTGSSWGTASTLTHESALGHPDGYLRITLFSSGARGYWMQAFQVEGARPFSAAVNLDLEINGGLSEGYLLVSVDSSPADPPSAPDPRFWIATVPFRGPMSWSPLGPFRNDTQVRDPGRIYYLKVGFIASVTSGPVDVGLDNVRLSWTTDAGVVFYLPAPYPVRIVATQDRAAFLTYYGFIFAAIFLIGGYYAVREQKVIWNAFRAPLEAIGTRLRARSAWIAVGQVWMAITFVQVAIVLFLAAIRVETPSPIQIDSQNAWVFLFELANAGVYEEFAFRLLLIGAPMAIGSLAVRALEVTRGTNGRLPGSAGRYLVGGWRYLFGGVLRRESPREAHAAAWALLFASAAVFGLAHAPGWGWWKVVPAFVAGLGFGYLFLRHGIGAAILAHFVNDYIFSLYYEGIGGVGLQAFIVVLLFGLAMTGAGFLIWYAIDAVRHLTALIDRFRPPRRVRPAVAPPVAFGSPPPIPYASPGPAPSSPPSPVTPGPGTSEWSAAPYLAPPAGAFRDAGRIPRDYTPSFVPPPYGYPPVRFQCPSCGWVEARYDGGRFTCTRCGKTA